MIQHQNSIDELPDLSKYTLENIFPVYKDNDMYFYNLLRTVRIPDNIESVFYSIYNINTPEPLTNISYKFYGTIELWWLICTVNQIDNPVELFPGGTKLKIIKLQYIDKVIDRIKSILI